MCRVMGLPGKPDGMSGGEVEKYYREGRLREIADYCETDVVNTYLVFLRFQAMRGALTAEQYHVQCELVRSTLARSTDAHWQQFLSHWPVA